MCKIVKLWWFGVCGVWCDVVCVCVCVCWVVCWLCLLVLFVSCGGNVGW